MQKLPRQKLPLGADNLLSVFEGIEGGFAICTGIIVGLSFQPISRELILMTALIGIIVNAFNASAVRYTSEHYLDELDGREKRRRFHYYFIPALLEFAVYGAVSALVIIPLLVIESLQVAVVLSILLTLAVLFAAGVYRGYLMHTHRLRDGFEVATLGGLIIVAGGLSGWILSRLVA